MMAMSTGQELSELSQETAMKLKATFDEDEVEASQCHLDAFKKIR